MSRHIRFWLYFLIITNILMFLYILWAPVFSIHGPKKNRGFEGESYGAINLWTESIQLIENYYVEPVDEEPLIQEGIQGMLSSLDPHSYYLDPEENVDFNEETEGAFYGIGISYEVIDDAIVIITTSEGSPAALSGISPGDRIIKVNGNSVAHSTYKNLRDQFRGEGGTSLELELERPGVEGTMAISLVRDLIKVKSIPAAFMVDSLTAYIRVSSFMETTFNELEKHLRSFEKEGMRRLILDLRYNGGGLLDEAIQMAELFLYQGEEIVNTRGRDAGMERVFRAGSEDNFTELALIIMISHQTASASEIVAGAIQDWDRGLVVGVRSFGKGLVQQPFPLTNGGAILLTIAKYYTPAGRLIQRDFSKGSINYYQEDLDRFQTDTTRSYFYTKGKRKVWGGGGIAPDYNIHWHDTSQLLTRLSYPENLIVYFATTYARNHLLLKNDFGFFLNKYEVSDSVFRQFIQMAHSKAPAISLETMSNKSDLLKRQIKYAMALFFWGPEKAWQTILMGHPDLMDVMRYFPRADSLVTAYNLRH